MASVDEDNVYVDVFVFGDLVYAVETLLHVVHVYRNRNNSLIKLHDIKYSCECNDRYFPHSIVVTNDHILQCCARNKLVSVLDRSGELLRTIPIVDISGHRLILCQVDDEENFLIADRWTNCLVVANANQPSYQWDVVDLPDLPDSDSFKGAVWFRHRLHVASDCRLLTFTPRD